MTALNCHFLSDLEPWDFILFPSALEETRFSFGSQSEGENDGDSETTNGRRPAALLGSVEERKCSLGGVTDKKKIKGQRDQNGSSFTTRLLA